MKEQHQYGMIGIEHLVIDHMGFVFDKHGHLIHSFCLHNLVCIGIGMMKHQFEHIDHQKDMVVKHMGFPMGLILFRKKNGKNLYEKRNVLRSHRRDSG